MKSNPLGLEGARYLRVGIVPASETRTDRPYMDEKRRLAACPLPTKGSFMDTFYKGWEIVRFFLAADAKLPSEAALPRPLARHVARLLAERREFPFVVVVDVLAAVAQPELLEPRSTGRGRAYARLAAGTEDGYRARAPKDMMRSGSRQQRLWERRTSSRHFRQA